MKKTGIFRSGIIIIVLILSFSGMILVNSNRPDDNSSDKLILMSTFQKFLDTRLTNSFEDGFTEVDVSKAQFPLNLEIEKGYEISNKLLEVGRIYHVKIDDKFDSREALRKMLDVLSEKYIRIRRESLIENNSRELISTEESGYVFDEFERYNYISKIITHNDDAWLFVLTFNENSRRKVEDLLKLIWMEQEKGVRLS
jgi:hypothetical protein